MFLAFWVVLMESGTVNVSACVNAVFYSSVMEYLGLSDVCSDKLL